MQRLLSLSLLLLSAALAGPCDAGQPERVGQKTEITTFGERCLEFDLGGAAEKPYRVTALTVPVDAGRSMLPLNRNGVPVNTLDQPVTLKAGQVTEVTVDYQASEVAYVQINFKVGVQKGTLYRNGRAVLEKNSWDYNNLLWGTLWTTTFGLISLIWLPNVTETLQYTEVLPLDAPWVHYSYHAGGNCFSALPNEGGFWVRPAGLKAGHVYPINVDIKCDAGIWATIWLPLSAPRWGNQIRWVRRGLPPTSDYGYGIVTAPTIAPGAEIEDVPLHGQRTIHHGGGIREADRPVLPRSWRSRYQMDRMWSFSVDPTTGIRILNRREDYMWLCMLRREDGTCIKTAVYRRIAAEPPGPIDFSVSWGFPATYVGRVVTTGPNGELVSKPDVHYHIPAAPDIVMTDTFQCIIECP